VQSIHGRINQALAFVVLILGVYICISPFIEFPWQKAQNFPSGIPIAKRDNNLKGQPNSLWFTKGPQIKTEIVEGKNLGVINHGGIWRLPYTSEDPSSSNMVIVGHSFTYETTHPPFRTLYETKVGDKIRMIWHEKVYYYKVVKTEVHDPHDVYIEQPTEQPRLTLYSCYPPFTTNQRFVVIAEQIRA
jgi:LPXTG-site transpeptidase (sortase) family protein